MSPYQILGVSEQASEAEIKKAYKTLCGRFHPDKESGDEVKFKEVQAAYSRITEPHKFEHEQPRHHNPFGGFNFNQFHHIKVKVELTLEEAFSGTDKLIFIPYISQHMNITIQAGTQHLSETQFTLSGDNKVLIVNLHHSILKHSEFILEGNDLKIYKTFPMIDFYKDNDILITSIEGKEFKIKLAANSNPGTRLRLKGKGFINNGVRGNLIIIANVELPILSAEKIIKLGELLNEDN